MREERPEGAMTYATVEGLLQALPDMLRKGDGLLVKGSRKLHLEQVTDFLVARYGGGSCAGSV